MKKVVMKAKIKCGEIYIQNLVLRPWLQKLSIGDNVRMTEIKNLFDKGYTQRWTEEVFKISTIQLTILVTYKIADYNGEDIQGSFYEQELQKTS